MALQFHNAMTEPNEAQRADLDKTYQRWLAARSGSSYDDEYEAANDLIEALMEFGDITYEDD